MPCIEAYGEFEIFENCLCHCNQKHLFQYLALPLAFLTAAAPLLTLETPLLFSSLAFSPLVEAVFLRGCTVMALADIRFSLSGVRLFTCRIAATLAASEAAVAALSSRPEDAL